MNMQLMRPNRDPVGSTICWLNNFDSPLYFFISGSQVDQINQDTYLFVAEIPRKF